MNPLPVEELLAPLSEDAPCGTDLEYDTAFLALQEGARGKPEQQFGDTLIAAQPPDWREVFDQALSLARRTRDLRVAVLLARSAARLHGLPPYADALALVAALLERYWMQVHPQLEADAGENATMRLNALAPLADGDSGLADLRSAMLVPGRAGLSVRQLELAFGKATPGPGESPLAPEVVLQALQDAEAKQAGLLAALARPQAALLRIEAVLAEKCGTAQAVDLRALRRLADALAQAGAAAQGVPSAAVATQGNAAPATVKAGAAGGALCSRSDVLRSLDSACDWIERHEPTNPAPLLIRRAQRLMNKNFIEIIRDLVPDGIDQVEKIAGSPGEA